MPVEVRDDCASGRIPFVADCAERILILIGAQHFELGVVLTDDPGIRELNRSYRSKDVATDVLSFPQLELDGSSPASVLRAQPAHVRLLGDVVISVETARRQAEAGGWLPEEEIARLLVHGVLHLVGHEHEEGGEQAERMVAEERRLAAALIHAGVPCAGERAD